MHHRESRRNAHAIPFNKACAKENEYDSLADFSDFYDKITPLYLLLYNVSNDFLS